MLICDVRGARQGVPPGESPQLTGQGKPRDETCSCCQSWDNLLHPDTTPNTRSAVRLGDPLRFAETISKDVFCVSVYNHCVCYPRSFGDTKAGAEGDGDVSHYWEVGIWHLTVHHENDISGLPFGR